MNLKQENALCVCGCTFEQHEERNGYCPLRLDEKFQPAPDLPHMALRTHHDSDLLDDIVVKDVTMFRAEQMSEDTFWVCCYLRNGERITWNVYANCRPRRIAWAEGETTPYFDIDAKDET